jgi:hypothetical protein
MVHGARAGALLCRMLPMDLDQLITAGGVPALERQAATQAIEETRRFWLPVLETLAAGPDHNALVRMYLAGEVRRLRRALKLPPPPPSETDREWQRRQTRDRVRRHRARRKVPVSGSPSRP